MYEKSWKVQSSGCGCLQLRHVWSRKVQVCMLEEDIGGVVWAALYLMNPDQFAPPKTQMRQNYFNVVRARVFTHRPRQSFMEPGQHKLNRYYCLQKQAWLSKTGGKFSDSMIRARLLPAETDLVGSGGWACCMLLTGMVEMDRLGWEHQKIQTPMACWCFLVALEVPKVYESRRKVLKCLALLLRYGMLGLSSWSSRVITGSTPRAVQ